MFKNISIYKLKLVNINNFGGGKSEFLFNFALIVNPKTSQG